MSRKLAEPDMDSATRRWDVELRGAELRPMDLAQRLANELAEYPPTAERWRDIAVVLSEIITNAIEHGVLGLSGEQKNDPQYLATYFDEFDRRLAATTDDDFVRVSISHLEEKDSLWIRVEDSGEGFDPKTAKRREPGNAGVGGRGLMLLEHYCESIEYSERGNTVLAKFSLAEHSPESTD